MVRRRGRRRRLPAARGERPVHRRQLGDPQRDPGARGVQHGHDRRRHRPSVVLGVPVSGDEGGHCRRDAHSRRHAGQPRGDDRGRHPQLLGAGAEPQDRHDPGPGEPDPALLEQGRRLPRRLRRVLRAAARAHGDARVRPAEGAVPGVAEAAVRARGQARHGPRSARRAGLPQRLVLELPRDPRHDSARLRRPRPDPSREPHHARRRDHSRYQELPHPLGRRLPALQAGERDAGLPPHRLEARRPRRVPGGPQVHDEPSTRNGSSACGSRGPAFSAG